jgi:hypothetical protein
MLSCQGNCGGNGTEAPPRADFVVGSGIPYVEIAVEGVSYHIAPVGAEVTIAVRNNADAGVVVTDD